MLPSQMSDRVSGVPSRRRFAAIIIVVVFLLATVFLFLILPNSTISKQGFRQLSYGMTKEQVESILRSKGTVLYPGANAYYWGYREKYILIYFSAIEPGHAIGGNYVEQGESFFDLRTQNGESDDLQFEVEPQPESTMERVRRWVREWTGW